MAKFRYFSAIASVFIVLGVCMFILTDLDFGIRIVAGLGFGFLTAELIFWQYSLATRVFLFFMNIIRIIFVFWITFFTTGSIVFVIIGFAIASFLFGAMGSVFSFALFLMLVMSPLLFFLHIITYATQLED